MTHVEHPWFTPPVQPYAGTRGIDDFGAGGFGAPRDGRSRVHKGLDCLGAPGASCVFPCDGRVWPPSGLAYAHNAELRSIHILGEGAWQGWRVNLLYVSPGVIDDSHGKRGDPIGTLQDVAAWHTRDTTGKVMQNHCHMELYEQVNGVWVVRDPARYLKV